MIFDVGAFRGDKTAQYLRQGHSVVCFEPNPLYAQKLRARFKCHVTVLEKAVGAKQGMITMMICSRNPSLSTCANHWKQGRFQNQKWDREIEVAVTTLDAAIEQYSLPDFIKIDVEGYELKVLQGLSQKVAMLSFEFAGEFCNDADNCLKRLKEIGYRQFNLKFDKHNQFALPWTNTEEILIQLTKQPTSAWGDIYTRKENINEPR